MKSTVLLIFVLITLAGTGMAPSAIAESVPLDEASLIILPFINNTQVNDANRIMTNELFRQLNERGVTYADTTELRQLLRQYRIRTSGMLSGEDAKILKEHTNASMIMIGSFDFYSELNMNEVGFSYRIVDLHRMHIKFATDAYDIGLMDGKVFRTGETREIATVLTGVMDQALAGINDSLITDLKNKEINPEAVTIAIVEFDNFAQFQSAGKIVSTQLLNSFHDLGFNVIEPGVVFEAMIDQSVRYRGEIDYSIAQYLNREYNMLLLCTGGVITFKPGTSNENLPQAEYTIRMLDGPSQHIVGMYQKKLTGGDFEKLFQIGACKSLGQLSRKLLDRMITTFKEDRHYDEYTRLFK